MTTVREGKRSAFPVQTVTILVLCMTLNNYSLVSLFPYIGVMVMDLLGLETTNEAGEILRYRVSTDCTTHKISQCESTHIYICVSGSYADVSADPQTCCCVFRVSLSGQWGYTMSTVGF